MKKLIRRFPIIVVCAVSVLFMALFAACSGVAVPTTNSPATVTGTIKSVNTSNGSVTLTVNGQDVTINGLSSAQVSQLQSQVGKTYSITAVQNSDGSYTLSTGSNTITIAVGTPAGIQTPSGNGSGSAGSAVAGTISFIGKGQSVNGNNIVVSMPDSYTIGSTADLGDFNNNAQGIQANQPVKVEVLFSGSNGTVTKVSLNNGQ